MKIQPIASLIVFSIVTSPGAFAADPMPPASAPSAQSTVPNPEANMVLTELQRSNAAEIEMGKLAQSKSPNASIREYGQTLVSDYQDAQKKVIALASDRNLSFATANDTSSGESASPHKNAAMESLNTLKGAAFDRSFLKQMVADHTKVVSMLRDARPKLTDAPDVEAFVVELIPVLEKHLSKANDLLKQAGKST